MNNCIVHGIAKQQTGLSDFHFRFQDNKNPFLFYILRNAFQRLIPLKKKLNKKASRKITTYVTFPCDISYSFLVQTSEQVH